MPSQSGDALLGWRVHELTSMTSASGEKALGNIRQMVTGLEVGWIEVVAGRLEPEQCAHR